MGHEMMQHAFPFGTFMLILVGVAVVGFGWWRVNGDATAARATALYSVAFVGLFMALVSGFVFLRAFVADVTDAAPGHEQMMSRMAGMMSAGIPGGMMGGHEGMRPDLPSGHPMMPWQPSPSPSPQVQVNRFSVMAGVSTGPSPTEAPSPSSGPTPGAIPPGHPVMPGMGGSGGVMPGMPGMGGSGGMYPGGMMGSPAAHQQMMGMVERSQRSDATTSALFLIAGLLAWWLSLSAARKLDDRPELVTYRSLVFAGSVLTLIYGSVVAALGLVHAVAPGAFVDSFIEDLQRRGGIVELIAGGALAAASLLVMRSVRGEGAGSAPGPEPRSEPVPAE